MIKVEDLYFSYGETPIFENTSFIIGKNQKVGLVGKNGAGKSTLFKLLTGEYQIGRGKLEVQGLIGYVPQEVTYDPLLASASSVREYLNPNNKLHDFELKKMMNGLELQEVKLDNETTGLSGGQKTKLALARALLALPEILILDEPTNFMDVQGKKFVMNFLVRYSKTLLIVSHDLDLLDRAIDKVLYINSLTKNIDEYKGNYTAFKKLKSEKEALEKRLHILAQKKVKRMEKAVTRAMSFRSDKGVRVRVQLQKRLQKMKETMPEAPQEIKKFRLNFPEPASVSEVLLKAQDISKVFGSKQIFTNLNFVIHRGERICIAGINGAGKSTLIKSLLKHIRVDTGEVFQAPNLKLGYYSQGFESFDLSKSLLDIAENTFQKDEGYCRALLGKFLFVGESVHQKIESLSGGEKTRLAIALLCGVNYNLLVLDEPTTYLDPMSQRIILEALKSYKGTLLIVSHNPEFLSELSLDYAYLMPGGKMVYWDQIEASLQRYLEE